MDPGQELESLAVLTRANDLPRPLSDLPSINVKVLGTLRSFDKETASAFLSELIDIFLQDSQDYMARLQTALEQRDSEAATKAAHAFKGGSGNLGAEKLATLAHCVESAGRTGAWDQIDLSLQLLTLELARVSELLLAEKASLQRIPG
jgi:HPt (histidine-containing phosphotransfer) domain-containing protein